MTETAQFTPNAIFGASNDWQTICLKQNQESCCTLKTTRCIVAYLRSLESTLPSAKGHRVLAGDKFSNTSFFSLFPALLRILNHAYSCFHHLMKRALAHGSLHHHT